MVNYIVTMPEESDTEARRYKYPYVSSEVLSCDLTVLRNAFFDLSSGLVEQLLGILLQPPPLAPILAGYCSKVIVSLYKSAPEQFAQFFAEHWEANPNSPITCAHRYIPHNPPPHPPPPLTTASHPHPLTSPSPAAPSPPAHAHSRVSGTGALRPHRGKIV